MSISNVGQAPPARTPESAEPKGPELRQDHDGDDTAAAKPVATPAAGQGTVVDTQA